MHSPDGKHFANESVFEDIVPNSVVVVRHVSEPRYRLRIALSLVDGGTRVTWAQTFDDAEIARKIEKIVVPANAQNLARLALEVGSAPHPGPLPASQGEGD